MIFERFIRAFSKLISVVNTPITRIRAIGLSYIEAKEIQLFVFNTYSIILISNDYLKNADCFFLAKINENKLLRSWLVVL